jgi:hypothetical protein
MSEKSIIVIDVDKVVEKMRGCTSADDIDTMQDDEWRAIRMEIMEFSNSIQRRLFDERDVMKRHLQEICQHKDLGNGGSRIFWSLRHGRYVCQICEKGFERNEIEVSLKVKKEE